MLKITILIQHQVPSISGLIAKDFLWETYARGVRNVCASSLGLVVFGLTEGWMEKVSLRGVRPRQGKDCGFDILLISSISIASQMNRLAAVRTEK